MNPGSARLEFEAFMARRGLAVSSLTPAEGLEAVLSFYRDQRADGCELDADGDMLLYQWGTYDWGQGEFFELDLTRQWILTEGDGEPVQLSLTFRFLPGDELRRLGDGNRWCHSPRELPLFERFIRESDAYAAALIREPESVELTYESTG